MIVIASIILNKTKLGRYDFAIGSNEEAKDYQGLTLMHGKLLSHTLGGAFVGIAGIVMASV